MGRGSSKAGRGSSKAGGGSLDKKLDGLQTVNFNLQPANTNMIKSVFPVDEHPKGLFNEGEYMDFLQRMNSLPNTETDVDVNNLIAIQNIVNKDGVRSSANSTEPIIVVEHNGQNYIIDGNHRATAAKLQGKKTIKARVTRM